MSDAAARCRHLAWCTITPEDRRFATSEVGLEPVFTVSAGLAEQSRRTRSPALLQADPHQLLEGGLRAEGIHRAAHGFVGFNLFEAERDQGQHGIIDLLFVGTQRALGAGRLPGADLPNLVLQFDDYALGRFLADTGDLRERFDVA